MKTILTLFLVALSITLVAQPEDARRRRNFNTDNYVAMREFDPVSYFAGKPQKGVSKFHHTHKGITYYFANQANVVTFKKDPAKYEPAYGGWCAYTVASTGERVKVLPTAYKIVDGKLHLFYNFSGDDRLRKWNTGNEKSLKASADKNWARRMH